MGLFSKHKKSEIPPVESAPSNYSSNSYSSSGGAPSYNRSNSNFSQNSGNSYESGKYGQQGGQGRYGQQDDSARNQLLGSNPNPALRSQLGNRFDQYDNDPNNYDASQQKQQEGDEEEEVEAIKQQIKFTKQESLASTRNAVRVAREAEEVARGNLIKLADQSERIANTERSLDLSKAHNSRAEDEAKEIKALNKSIFRPTFTINKQGKRDAEEARILARHLSEKEEREANRREMEQSRHIVGGAFQSMDRQGQGSSRGRSGIQERSRYQFESTGSDEELENELDDNLNEISDVVGRLKVLAQTAGQEVDRQNTQLSRIADKTDELDINIVKNTNYLKRLK